LSEEDRQYRQYEDTFRAPQLRF
jgi:hypothetical protein